MSFKWKNNEKTTNENRENIPGNEFKALEIRMLNKLGTRTDEHRENFNKELESTKTNRNWRMK